MNKLTNQFCLFSLIYIRKRFYQIFNQVQRQTQKSFRAKSSLIISAFFYQKHPLMSFCSCNTYKLFVCPMSPFHINFIITNWHNLIWLFIKHILMWIEHSQEYLKRKTIFLDLWLSTAQDPVIFSYQKLVYMVFIYDIHRRSQYSFAHELTAQLVH